MIAFSKVLNMVVSILMILTIGIFFVPFICVAVLVGLFLRIKGHNRNLMA